MSERGRETNCMFPIMYYMCYININIYYIYIKVICTNYIYKRSSSKIDIFVFQKKTGSLLASCGCHWGIIDIIWIVRSNNCFSDRVDITNQGNTWTCIKICLFCDLHKIDHFLNFCKRSKMSIYIIDRIIPYDSEIQNTLKIDF